MTGSDTESPHRREPTCLSGSSLRGSCGGLQIEQQSLGLQSTEVVAQATVGADHSVTRDEQREWIGGAGAAHGPDRLRVVDGGRDRCVARGVSVTDGGQVLEHPTAESRAEREIQRQVETLAAVREVLVE